MQNVMNGLANIMGNAKNKFKMQEFQKSIKTYATEKEKMEALNELIQDGMEFDDEIDDTDADALIRDKEIEMKHKSDKSRETEEFMEEDL